jgi:hypothetical protein
MEQSDLVSFKRWFSDYCKSFYSSDIKDQKNIYLKEHHTYNVCKNIIEIAKELSLSNNQILLAETIALFHDIGRFPQYAKYKTFRDSISVNHGLLGSRILIEKNVLQNLSESEQEIIIQSVRFHNAYSPPKKEKKEIIFFVKLLRDADKLDIWRVFIEYYENTDENRSSAAGLGLPDTPEYSEDILPCLHKKKIVSFSKIKTLNDFKLLQLSWVYDLNFKPSFRLLIEKDYLNKIISTLPQTREIHDVASILKEFVLRRV